MGALHFFNSEEIKKRGSIQDADVAKLRAAFYDDGVIDEKEAEMLFALNNRCPVQDPSWAVFFNEAIVDYVVTQAEPEGYVTSENASWLIDQSSENGKIRTQNDLELLVCVLEKSRWSPPSLVKFCIEQIRNSLIDERSPLRSGGGSKGKITESDVELIRRMVYAFGGDGNIAITRGEAELLFDINDAVAPAGVNPAWTEFFAKAIANVVMGSSGYQVPSREEALHGESFVEDRGELSPAGMISAIVNAGLDGVFAAYREQSREERAIARLERQRLEIVTNEKITDDEAGWLAQKLGRDEEITEPEQALLAYLQKYAGPLHSSLQDVVARYAAAA